MEATVEVEVEVVLEVEVTSRGLVEVERVMGGSPEERPVGEGGAGAVATPCTGRG